MIITSKAPTRERRIRSPWKRVRSKREGEFLCVVKARVMTLVQARRCDELRLYLSENEWTICVYSKTVTLRIAFDLSY